jgi:glycerophosphoryl diester phosphodiesterase
VKRILKLVGLALGLITLAATTIHVVRSHVELPARPSEFEIIAHRGVHQNFPSDNLTDETCTAARMYPLTHRFIENTIPAIREAFKDGATMVELDIHPTSDGHMVVFHDWGLDCRTNGRGVTHDHTLAELKKLDVGYGYTPDGGKTYPLRGSGVGLMPTLEEVLATFPDKKLIIHQKDTSIRTAEILAAIVNKLPEEQQKRLYWYGAPRPYAKVQQIAPAITKQFPFPGEMRQCAKSELLRLGFGELPQACHLSSMGLPAQYLWMVPGWPNAFLHKSAAAHVAFYVTEVDTVEEAGRLAQLPVNGIVTNRIEVIGPAIARARAAGPAK